MVNSLWKTFERMYLLWFIVSNAHRVVLQALLEQQLAVERGKMETEKKKFQHAMDEKVKFHLLYCMVCFHSHT